MNFNRQNLTVIVVAAIAVVGMVGFAGAVAPSLDTETTNTAGTTEIDGTFTQTYNDSTSSWLNTSQDSNQTAVEIRQGANGRLLANYTLGQDDNVEYVSQASGTYYHSTLLADDASDYPGIDVDAGQSVTLEARSKNLADSPTTTTNTTYTFTAGNNISFANANDSDTSTSDSTAAAFRGVLSNPLGNDSDAGAAQLEEDNVGINGQDQNEIVVHIDNADAQDSAAAVYDATEDTSSPSSLGVVTLNGESLLVFAEGQDTPDWFDENEHAYATIDSDGDTLTVQNAGEVVDAGDSQADLEVTANDAIGFGQAQSIASDNGAGFIDSVGFASNAVDANGTPEFEEV